MEHLLTTIRAGALARTLEEQLNERHICYVSREHDFIVTIDSEARRIWRTISPNGESIDDVLVSSQSQVNGDTRRSRIC